MHPPTNQGIVSANHTANATNPTEKKNRANLSMLTPLLILLVVTSPVPISRVDTDGHNGCLLRD